MISSQMGCNGPSGGGPNGRLSYTCPDCRSEAEPINTLTNIKCVGGTVEDGIQFSCLSCHIRFLANEKGFRRVLVWGKFDAKVKLTATA